MMIAAVHRNTVGDAASFDACLKTVSHERRQRVLSLVDGEKQRLGLCAGIALDACLRTVGLREAEEPLCRDDHGKPRLGRYPALHFSLSHSGEWAVCALADGPLGIDIERRRTVRAAALAARYFTPQEAELIAGLSDEEQQTAFFRLWTAKESLLKAQGTGLSGGLSVPIGYGETLTAPAPWRLSEYALPDHLITVCGEGDFPENPIIFSSYDSVLLR